MKLYSIKTTQGDASYCSILQETDAVYFLLFFMVAEGF
ncbi:hypothetical protein HMPREF9735_02005 [Treponema denticola ATCC 33521]|nr:hypothetical protein HMPREF9735_02005 [Treponema denticola ATCC 33521]